MNTFQIVMLSISGLLVLSVFWEQIQSFFSKVKKPDIFKPKNPTADEATSLVEVVSCWEKLKEGCERNNLQRAVHALKSIFPLLVIEEGDEYDV